MNVTVSLVGRVALDDQFRELWAQGVEVGVAPVVVLPAVPAEAAGHELEVRIAPADIAVSCAIFRPAPAEDDAAAVTLERASPIYGVFDRAPRQFPFYGTALALVAVGTDEFVPAFLVADEQGVRPL